VHYCRLVESSAKQQSVFPSHDPGSRERDLVAIIRQLLHELHPQRAKTMDMLVASRLERDLGIDSLGRTELILRIERFFRVRLGVTAAGQADTVGDLLRSLDQARRECPKVCVSGFRSVLFPLLLCFFSALKKQSDRRTGWRTAPWRPSIQWAFANARLHF